MSLFYFAKDIIPYPPFLIYIILTIDISGYEIRKDFHSTIMSIKRYGENQRIRASKDQKRCSIVNL